MTTLAPYQLPQDAIIVKDGHTVTTSLKVADIFGKPHKDVLGAIRSLDCPEEFAGRNFSPGSYLDANKQSRPMFEMTRSGFTLLVMGFTGAKAAQFKVAYIQRFDDMEQALHHAVPGEIGLSKDRYIELLEAENRLLKTPKPVRNKPVPLTNELICKIYDMLGGGLSGNKVAAELGIPTATVSFVRKLRPAIPLLTA